MSAMSQKLQTLLVQPALAGAYRLPHSDGKALKQAALALGFGWLHANFGGKRELPPILEKLGRDLRLPDWYGANLDALADCLTDLAWNTAPGYVLFIEGSDPLGTRNKEAFAQLGEVFDVVASHWRQENIPFWVIHDMQPGMLADLPAITAG